MRSLPFRLVSVTSPPRHSDDRAEAVPLRLEHPAFPAGKHVRRGREHRPVATTASPSCVLAQEEPVLRIAVERGRNERPHAVEPLAVEPHGQPAVLASPRGARTCRDPRSRPFRAPYSPAGITPSKSAYSSGWSSTCTARWRSPLPQRDALRHRPARQRTVALEPEVVVEAPRGVPLDHEARRARSQPRIPNGSGVLPA